MAMTVNSLGKRWGFINNKEAFNMWIELGSLNKVQAKFAELGMVNKEGKPPSREGLGNAAWKYALANPEEAYNRISETNRRMNVPVPTVEEWRKMMMGKAKSLLTQRKNKQFLSEHPEYAE